MLEVVDLVLEGVGDEVHEHQLLLATRWTGDPGLLLLVLGQKVGQVPVNPRLVSNLIKVRFLVTKHYLVIFHDVEKIKKNCPCTLPGVYGVCELFNVIDCFLILG